MLLTQPLPTPGDLYQVDDVAVNASGYSYTICKNDFAVQVFDPDGHFTTSWSFPFQGLDGIAINSSGYVYVADFTNIIVFDSGGKFIRQWQALNYTFADAVSETRPSLNNIGIGADNNVYAACTIGVTDSMNDPSRLRIFTPNGDRMNYQLNIAEVYRSWFSAGFNYGTDWVSHLNDFHYSGVAVNSTGFVYTTVSDINTVFIYNPQGNLIGVFNGTTLGAGTFNKPMDIAINSSDCVFLLDSGNNRTVVLDRNNRLLSQFGTTGTGAGQFRSPQGLGIDPSSDKLYVADTGNNRTQTFEYFGRYYDEVQVTVDNKPPVITGAPVTAANANGWYNRSVTVHFNAIDATSGLMSVTADQVLSGEGAGQSVTGTAVDMAGNVNATTVSGINIDTTPPVISCSLSGETSSEGWFVGNVTATLSRLDNLSGVDYVKYRFENSGWNTYNGMFVIPLGIQTILYYVVTDKAGNNASGSTYVYFPPASYSGGWTLTPSSSPSPTPTLTPSPSPTNTSGPTVTPAASPAASPGVSPVATTPEPVGQDMFFGIILIMVIVALVRSKKI